MNQGDFGALAGVKRGSQTEYEAGKRAFDATYLLNLQAHGIDGYFVLTGSRSADSLTDEQAQVLAAFDSLEADDRQALLRLATKAAGMRPPPANLPLPSTAALTEAFDELLEQSPGLAGADLAHELAKRLPIILRAAADERASPASASHDADDAPRAARGGDRRAARHAPRT